MYTETYVFTTVNNGLRSTTLGAGLNVHHLWIVVIQNVRIISFRLWISSIEQVKREKETAKRMQWE